MKKTLRKSESVVNHGFLNSMVGVMLEATIDVIRPNSKFSDDHLSIQVFFEDSTQK